MSDQISLFEFLYDPFAIKKNITKEEYDLLKEVLL